MQTEGTPEEVVIGDLITSPKYVHLVTDIIEPHMFEDSKCKIIYTEIFNLAMKGEPFDLIIISANLIAKGFKFDRELIAMSNLGKGAIHLANHAVIIRDNYKRREFKKITAKAYSTIDLTEIDVEIQTSIGLLEKIIEPPANLAEATKEEAIDEAMAQVVTATKGGSEMVGIPTGVSGLDQHIKGWRNGMLFIIAARPGMGKTNMVITGIMAAIRAKKKVAFFSLEMPSPEIYKRQATCGTAITSEMVDGKTNANGLGEIERQFEEMKKWDLIIKDQITTIEEIEVYSLGQAARGKPIQIIFIDYLQLMRSRGKHESMTAMVGDLAKRCKALAKRLSVPVILLSQLSRGVEERSNKRPILSDLRQSGEIEEAADMILFPFRPSYYDFDVDNESQPDILDIAKWRHGQPNVEIPCYMDYRHAQWMDIKKPVYTQPMEGGEKKMIPASENEAPF